MTNKMSQDECKEMFMILLSRTTSDIKNIDNSTPYSPNEPDWWLNMMELQRGIFRLQNKYNWNKGKNND